VWEETFWRFCNGSLFASLLRVKKKKKKKGGGGGGKEELQQ
jgi:hypothetical protein